MGKVEKARNGVREKNETRVPAVVIHDDRVKTREKMCQAPPTIAWVLMTRDAGLACTRF